MATLAAVAGYIGVEGGGASHAGGTASIRSTPGITDPGVQLRRVGEYRRQRGEHGEELDAAHDQIITKQPNPIDFMWFANSNFINMSPDANKIINEVLPNISTIVTVDPYWTWTAKYSDYVLPACNYWEKWDFLDRSPWVFFQSPAVTPAGESKSDDRDHVPARCEGAAWATCGTRPMRSGCASFVNEEHPAWEGFDFDKAVEEGIWGRSDGIYDSRHRLR